MEACWIQEGFDAHARVGGDPESVPPASVEVLRPFIVVHSSVLSLSVFLFVFSLYFFVRFNPTPSHSDSFDSPA